MAEGHLLDTELTDNVVLTQYNPSNKSWAPMMCQVYGCHWDERVSQEVMVGGEGECQKKKTSRCPVTHEVTEACVEYKVHQGILSSSHE